MPVPTQNPPVPLLLKTKLNMPRLKSNLVLRRPLLDRLTEGVQRDDMFFLISAPAGYGKTTLICEWLNSESYRHTWLSLDENDNDPIRFFNYLIAAFSKHIPEAGQFNSSLYKLPQLLKLPPVDILITPLINDLADLNEPMVLVLDDYHRIHTRYIHDIVQFVIDHRPSLLHLVLITRQDPPLAIARMRAEGMIFEFRAADLRFSEAETATFMAGTMQLNLENEAISLLNVMIEGWIAGLQLAALWMQRRTPEEIAGFIIDFRGSHRYITDYLVSEIIANIPREIHDFLRQTAGLDRLSAPLCNAVIGREDSQTILEFLEHSNFFLFPLDDQRQWYRYHHLFANTLYMELGREEQQAIHQKAAHWYEANGYLEDAVNQAIAAADYPEAGRLIEMVSSEILSKGHLITLMNWIDALPASFVNTHNGLAITKSFVLYFQGQIETVIPYITGLESISQNQFSAFDLCRLYTIRAILANDWEEPCGLKLAHRALDLVKESDIYYICALSTYGIALRSAGNLNEAIRAFNDGFRFGQKRGLDFATILILKNLLFSLELKGRRYEAIRLGENVVSEMIDHYGLPLPLAKILYLPLGLFYYKENNLEQALKFLVEGIDICRKFSISRLLNGESILAMIYNALGDFPKAITIIREAIRETDRSVQPLVAFENDALEAELLLRQGEFQVVADWVEFWRLKPDDKPTPPREQPYFTYVRFLLAQEHFQEALNLLQYIESSARAGQRYSRLITVHILQGLTYNLAGDELKSLQYLTRALELAAPEGYYRPFLDEDPRIAAMLSNIQAAAPEFVTHLLKVLTKTAVNLNNSVKPFGISLIEPLSCREEEILGLIAAGLSNEAITRKLAISINTTKWHIYNIFQKLNVNSRTQAVAKAKELDLI